MPNNARLVRINDEIMREVAHIIKFDLKDPRIAEITSVTKVETSSDLAYAKVYVSIYGDEGRKKEVVSVLKNASGFIRKEIAERINLRTTPELKFILDDSIEYAARIDELIKDANKRPEGAENVN